ncbi:MAG: 7-carboxy-7-deazaguanine synthase QueE [bacterium]
MKVAIRARIIEIMSSLQGEGFTLGERQIFIRFAGCNFRCSYCDTRNSWDEEALREYTVDSTLNEIEKLNRDIKHKRIAITGGEPLLQVEFLNLLLPELRSLGFEILLETNGYLVDELSRVIELCDIVSMDIKFYSQCAIDTLPQHIKFLKVAGEKAYMKLVIDDTVNFIEVQEYIEILEKDFSKIPLVIQPATVNGMIMTNRNKEIFDIYCSLRTRFNDVRIIPQHHIIWGIR